MRNVKETNSVLLFEQEIADSFAITQLEGSVGAAGQGTRLSYHRMLLIRLGSGFLRIDEHQYPVNGMELFLLSKGQILNLHFDGPVQGYQLSFGDCFWEKSPASASNCKAVLFNDANFHQHMPLSAEEWRALEFLFAQLQSEYEAGAYINKLDAMAAYLKIIMIKTANIRDTLRTAYNDHENQVYRTFMELLVKQYQSAHSVAYFADQLGISSRKLSDTCKKYSGRGAKDLINGQLIAEAKRSLQFSAKPVKQIAYELSFSTAEQFSHFFKSKNGLSPESYRSSFVKIGM